MIEKKLEQLIEILLDKNEEMGARDDAAMNLRKYDHPLALESLLKIASTPDKDEEFLADVCGESIAKILLRTNHFDAKYLEKMIPTARREAIAVITENKPEWLKRN
ncbi:MAG: hypothetical protein P4M12_02445 [Gammaproteobacteria bacterium]|nr:hypothetical protein [Gammaproteobacteria bacterium]